MPKITKAEKDAGIPLFTSLRRSGATDEEMEQIEEDYAREQAMSQAGMAAALLEAQSQFNAGQPGQSSTAVGQPQETKQPNQNGAADQEQDKPPVK
ncbi:MAG: hypothetical protein IPJ94_19595 [Chloroflexi bacterium]|nr:hypothetical protein [Chloroflexota bacterium]